MKISTEKWLSPILDRIPTFAAENRLNSMNRFMSLKRGAIVLSLFVLSACGGKAPQQMQQVSYATAVVDAARLSNIS